MMAAAISISTPTANAKLSTSVSSNTNHTAPDAQDVTQSRVHVIEQSLPSFLRQIARRNGYQIELSKRVRGLLQNKRYPMDLRKVMPLLAEQFDLKWHFQEKQIYVSVGAENTSRLIYLGQMKPDGLKTAIEQAGIEAKDYGFTFVEESNSVLINGSAAYIASVELIAESFNKKLKNKKSNVKIIRFGNVGN
jgi:type II secretory pathway component GspD/PulD (secretin)